MNLASSDFLTYEDFSLLIRTKEKLRSLHVDRKVTFGVTINSTTYSHDISGCYPLWRHVSMKVRTVSKSPAVRYFSESVNVNALHRLQ